MCVLQMLHCKGFARNNLASIAGQARLRAAALVRTNPAVPVGIPPPVRARSVPPLAGQGGLRTSRVLGRGVPPLAGQGGLRSSRVLGRGVPPLAGQGGLRSSRVSGRGVPPLAGQHDIREAETARCRGLQPRDSQVRGEFRKQSVRWERLAARYGRHGYIAGDKAVVAW